MVSDRAHGGQSFGVKLFVVQELIPHVAHGLKDKTISQRNILEIKRTQPPCSLPVIYMHSAECSICLTATALPSPSPRLRVFHCLTATCRVARGEERVPRAVRRRLPVPQPRHVHAPAQAYLRRRHCRHDRITPRGWRPCCYTQVPPIFSCSIKTETTDGRSKPSVQIWFSDPPAFRLGEKVFRNSISRRVTFV